MTEQVKEIEFRNESGYEFKDISSERWRKYTFPNGRTIIIEKPLKIYVSENGHRIFDSSGMSHYIPHGWIHLKWLAKDDSPHFDF